MKKELGQVMTPPNIVSHMIDILHLSQEEIHQSYFLENSCGEGAFVKELLRRGVPREHIYACDIDPDISVSVRELLPTENFFLGDAFELPQKLARRFDFVVGNPPYLRTKNIPEERRAFLRDNCELCHGMFDMYLAFFDLGLKMLKTEGALVYITPSSFTKSASGEALRDLIEKAHLLRWFEEFDPDDKVFDDVSAYPCITILSKTRGEEIAPPWREESNKKHLLTYSSIQNGLATLADDIFIQRDFSFLEETFVRYAYKASTGEMKQIIIPPRDEEKLREKAPKTYDYLLSHRDRLERRALEKGGMWFGLGRTQGLKNMAQEKIAISTINPRDKIRFCRLPANVYVYSGLYATAENLDLLHRQLRSQPVLDEVARLGKPMRGGYIQLSSSLLKKL